MDHGSQSALEETTKAAYIKMRKLHEKVRIATSQAWNIHQYSHKIKTEEKIEQSITEANEKISTLKTDVVPTQEPLERRTPETAYGDLRLITLRGDLKQIEFECPLCQEVFEEHFFAFQHIKEFHCNSGTNMSPHSPLIEPILVECCTICNCRNTQNELHLCSETSLYPLVGGRGRSRSCACIKCERIFTSIAEFDFHVLAFHCDDFESMLFPTIREFLKWKMDMELETNTKYLIFNKGKSIHILRCTFLLNAKERADDSVFSYICPSSIVVRKYSQGIQVHFYKEHCGHPSPSYNVPAEYKKYDLTFLLRKSDSLPIKESLQATHSTDLYVQFKTIMKHIVVDAGSLQTNNLKVVIAKALDMAGTLKQYAARKHVYDSPTLNSTPKRGRPRIHNIERIMNTPTILNTFSLPGDSPEKKMPIKSSETAQLAIIEMPPKAETTLSSTMISSIDKLDKKKYFSSTNHESDDNKNLSLCSSTATVTSAAANKDDRADMKDDIEMTDDIDMKNDIDIKDEFIDPIQETLDPINTNSKIYVLSTNDINEKYQHNLFIGVNAL